LLSSAVRLSGLGSAEEVCGAAVEEAAALLGARRVLLALGAPEPSSIAAARVPRGEDAGALHAAVATWLEEAASTRSASLRHGPAGVAPPLQRSCVVAPLLTDTQVLGVVYADVDGRFGRFEAGDCDALSLLAAQTAAALERLRGSERLAKEIEQRNAELAVINAIQQGISAELDLQAIVDLVGDKLREVFDTGNVNILWWDDKTDTVQVLYRYEHGRPLPLPPPWPLDRDTPVTDIIRKREPRVANTREEQTRAGISPAPGTDWAHSIVGVPIVGSNRVIGVIGLQNHDREYAYRKEDVRLLETIAASMGVALENARLFDETQRLLRETAQRNAELAVVTSIQQGIAGSLSFQAIVEMVGDKLREVLHIDTIGIRWYDHDTRTAHFLYEIEHGTRLEMMPVVASEQRWKEVTGDRSVVIRNTRAEVAAAGVAPGTECSLSTLTVKIVAHDRVVGVVIVESFEREYAFGPSEARLLEAIVSGMGVALENARLFDETQRLLKETEERNAELAVINRIQQAVGAALDFEGIVDVVGDALREVFRTGDVGIRWWDESADRLRGLYLYEHNVRLDKKVLSPTVGTPWGPFLRHPRPVVLNSHAEQDAAGVRAAPGTDRALSIVAVPMIVGDRVVGAVNLEDHQREHAFGESQVRLLQTIASSMGVALENVRLFNETREALDRQTATADVLKVIAQSPGELQPVFDAIAASSNRLIGGFSTVVARIHDDVLHLVAYTSTNPDGDAAIRASFPNPLSSFSFGAALRAGRTVRIVDTELEPEAPVRLRELARARGYRSMLLCPLLRDGAAIGMISVTRREPGAFAEHEVQLLETFAHQAVIAIENVRLFNETKEALEQQTATARVLQVMSQSPADVEPVFEAITDRALALCGARIGGVARFDGELVHLAAFHAPSPEGLAQMHAAFPMKPSRGSILARAILEREALQIYDVLADPDYVLKDATRQIGYRSNLAVPMMRDGEVIGAIGVCREEPSVFSEKHIRLLQIFADQAVIAVENVRLFNETRDALRKVEQRTRELAEALDYQVAISDVLRVISQSPNDVSPVFEAILDCATRLFGSAVAAVYRYRDGQVELVGTRNWPDEAIAVARTLYPAPPERALLAGRVIAAGEALSIDDAWLDAAYDHSFARAGQWRRVAGAPMLKASCFSGASATACSLHGWLMAKFTRSWRRIGATA
jgi:GAF domain-containing protein